MTKQEFISRLRVAVDSFSSFVSTQDGQWVVKGFIDVYKNIYTISTDTKVVSKIIELYIFPLLYKFAKDNKLRLELRGCLKTDVHAGAINLRAISVIR